MCIRDSIYKDQFPEEIENWQGDTSDPTFKRDEFELYGGPYSPLPISKIKDKIQKNQYFAAISYEDGSYVWKRTKVVQVGKKQWKLRYLEMQQIDGTPFEKSFGADEGIYLKKISKSLCEEYEAIWLERGQAPTHMKIKCKKK